MHPASPYPGCSMSPPHPCKTSPLLRLCHTQDWATTQPRMTPLGPHNLRRVRLRGMLRVRLKLSNSTPVRRAFRGRRTAYSWTEDLVIQVLLKLCKKYKSLTLKERSTDECTQYYFSRKTTVGISGLGLRVMCGSVVRAVEESKDIVDYMCGPPHPYSDKCRHYLSSVDFNIQLRQQIQYISIVEGQK